MANGIPVDIHNENVPTLRQIARNRMRQGKLKLAASEDTTLGVWINSAGRDDLLNALDTGIAVTGVSADNQQPTATAPADLQDSRDNAAQTDAEEYDESQDWEDLGDDDDTEEDQPASDDAEQPAEPTNGNGHRAQPATIDDDATINEAMEALKKALSQPRQAQIDPEQIQQMIDAAVERAAEQLREQVAQQATTFNVTTAEHPEPRNVGHQHEKFPLLLDCIANRLLVWLVGPAGTGKTTMAANAAHALDLDFFPYSCHPEMSSFDLVGYNDANGQYVPGLLYEPFANGGVVLLDEIDNGNPSTLAQLNSLLANGSFTFPNRETVTRHEKFAIVAAANTFGTGPDAQYVGRNPLDAATLDRFVFIEIDVDEQLEDTFTENKDWIARVRKIRKAADDIGAMMIVSPRATIHGAKLLAVGWKQKDVENAVIWQGVDSETRSKVQGAI